MLPARMSFPRHFGLGLTVGVGGAAIFFLVQKGQKREAAFERQHKALKYGLPSKDNLRFFDNFVVSFDTRLRNPQWVLEHVTRESSSGEGNRKNVEFREDCSFEERFRSRLSDYRGSGYDRGHLAPAANHKASQKAMDDTFLLTNISPQIGKGFNRDYWARFERFLKQLSYSCEDLYIVTGPLFLPRQTPQGFEMHHPMIGEPPCLVAVPTHFFKVVLGCRSAETVAASNSPASALAAFVMPNAAIQPDIPLTAFSVPLEALECASGLQFFPGYISTDKRRLHDEAALSWQIQGRKQALEQRRQQETLPLPLGSNGREALSSLDPLYPPWQPAHTEDARIAYNELPIGILDKSPAAQALGSLSAPVNLLTERPGAEVQPSERLLHRDAATATSIRTSDSVPGLSSASSTTAGPTNLIHQEAKAVVGQDKAAIVARINSSRLGLTTSSVPGGSQAVESSHEKPSVISMAGERAASSAGLRERGHSEFGMLHLCDLVTCQLPPPDWYLKRRAPKMQRENSERGSIVQKDN